MFSRCVLQVIHFLAEITQLTCCKVCCFEEGLLTGVVPSFGLFWGDILLFADCGLTFPTGLESPALRFIKKKFLSLIIAINNSYAQNNLQILEINNKHYSTKTSTKFMVAQNYSVSLCQDTQK